jgi:phospholipid/cholesterol/gamma-HCH transport system permease protein
MIAAVRTVVEDAGELTLLAGRSASAGVRWPRIGQEVMEQLDALGTRSIAIAALTAIFSSLVMTVQFSVQLARFGAKAYVGNVVALSLVRELGPVLTALLVGGRLAAGITAELGSMQVTEQVDALRAMGADPVEKLVVPRVIAGTVALPLLTALVDLIGIVTAVAAGAIDTTRHSEYFYSAITATVTISDVVGGLVKAVFFGLFITLIACHRGLRTRGGTEGVGRATTQAVVLGSITVIVADYLLTKTLLAFGL